MVVLFLDQVGLCSGYDKFKTPIRSRSGERCEGDSSLSGPGAQQRAAPPALTSCVKLCSWTRSSGERREGSAHGAGAPCCQTRVLTQSAGQDHLGSWRKGTKPGRLPRPTRSETLQVGPRNLHFLLKLPEDSHAHRAGDRCCRPRTHSQGGARKTWTGHTPELSPREASFQGGKDRFVGVPFPQKGRCWEP